MRPIDADALKKCFRYWDKRTADTIEQIIDGQPTVCDGKAPPTEFDKEETYPNCTVQVFINTKTGDVKVNWRKNKKGESRNG